MNPEKRKIVYTILIIVAVFLFAIIFFVPKVTITYNQNDTLTAEEKNQITSIIYREYKHDPSHIGGNYSINIGESQKITNPEKMDYELFVSGYVKASEIIDSTETGENSWRLIVAKDKAGNWKLVGDVLCCANGMDWY